MTFTFINVGDMSQLSKANPSMFAVNLIILVLLLSPLFF